MDLITPLSLSSSLHLLTCFPHRTHFSSPSRNLAQVVTKFRNGKEDSQSRLQIWKVLLAWLVHRHNSKIRTRRGSGSARILVSSRAVKGEKSKSGLVLVFTFSHGEIVCKSIGLLYTQSEFFHYLNSSRLWNCDEMRMIIWIWGKLYKCRNKRGTSSIFPSSVGHRGGTLLRVIRRRGGEVTWEFPLEPFSSNLTPKRPAMSTNYLFYPRRENVSLPPFIQLPSHKGKETTALNRNRILLDGNQVSGKSQLAHSFIQEVRSLEEHLPLYFQLVYRYFHLLHPTDRLCNR